MIFANVTATIFDHLPEFLYFPNVLSNSSCQKSNISLNLIERDRSKFFQQNLIFDYFNKVWSDVLQLDQQDVNFFINSIFDEHASSKLVNKYKLKFKSKPWTIPAI